MLKCLPMARSMLSIVAAVCIVSTAVAAPAPLKVVRIPLPEGGMPALQARINLDFLEVQAGAVTALVNDEERALLAQMGIRYQLVARDVNALVPGTVNMIGVGKYHTYASVVAELQQVAKSHPDIASYSTIGKSVEGREIPALKLEKAGANAAVRPKILYMGLHHAREWISVEVPMALIQSLVNGAKDPAIKSILESRTIWVVPVVNPDGFEYSQKSYTMWRKNRHKTWSMPGVNGVDPNRNYGFEWSGVGSSSMPMSETYRGPSPFSEPETQAVRDFATREHFTTSISFHSYSELVLFPWGYTTKDCPDAATFKKVAGEMAGFNHYTPETGAALYLVNGECDDWLYGSLGVRAFTIELATSFIPRDSEIPSITAPNVQAALHLARTADTLAHDPNTALHLMERLTGAGGAPRGPWSPGETSESFRHDTLAWAAEELAAGLAGNSNSQLTSGLVGVQSGDSIPEEMVSALRGSLAILAGHGDTASAQKVQSLLQSR